MNIPIKKSSRQFGYLIWDKKHDPEFKKMIGERSSVNVVFNGFILGEKKIDKKYYRISLGYKFTRALPSNHNMFDVKFNNDSLEVNSFYAE